MKKKAKTKNHINYKKKYVETADGGKSAPFLAHLNYYIADDECDSCGSYHNGREQEKEFDAFKKKLTELAERNSGVCMDFDYDFAEFEFFTEKGLKQFAKKAEDRYGYTNNLEVSAQKAEVNYEDFDL